MGSVLGGESFRDLKVWQQSMNLVEEIYRVTSRFPPAERFGLTSQIRRASVSISSNIGEGKRRRRQRAFLHHLDIALGSQGEVEVQDGELDLSFIASEGEPFVAAIEILQPS